MSLASRSPLCFSRTLSLSLSCTQSLSDKVVGLSGALQVLRFGAKHTNSKVRLALCQLPHPSHTHTHTLLHSHHSYGLRVAVYVAIACLSTLYSKLISVVPPLLLLLLLALLLMLAVAVDNFLEPAESSLQEVVGSFSLFI